MKDIHFNTLELIAAQPLNFDAKQILVSQTSQYEDASLNEIFDLLESAVETYNAIAPTLSQRLRESAEQEIEFFYALTQQRLGAFLKHPIYLNSNLVAA
jgi:hypothetical protein